MTLFLCVFNSFWVPYQNNTSILFIIHQHFHFSNISLTMFSKLLPKLFIIFGCCLKAKTFKIPYQNNILKKHSHKELFVFLNGFNLRNILTIKNNTQYFICSCLSNQYNSSLNILKPNINFILLVHPTK